MKTTKIFLIIFSLFFVEILDAMPKGNQEGDAAAARSSKSGSSSVHRHKNHATHQHRTSTNDVASVISEQTRLFTTEGSQVMMPACVDLCEAYLQGAVAQERRKPCTVQALYPLFNHALADALEGTHVSAEIRQQIAVLEIEAQRVAAEKIREALKPLVDKSRDSSVGTGVRTVERLPLFMRRRIFKEVNGKLAVLERALASDMIRTDQETKTKLEEVKARLQEHGRWAALSAKISPKNAVFFGIGAAMVAFPWLITSLVQRKK
jgi:hypothetical protein